MSDSETEMQGNPVTEEADETSNLECEAKQEELSASNQDVEMKPDSDEMREDFSSTTAPFVIKRGDPATDGEKHSATDTDVVVTKEDCEEANEKETSEEKKTKEDEKAKEEERLKDPKKHILWAAEKNEIEILRKLLEEDPSLVNATDNDLYTPLHRACYNNHAEVIKILLSYGADTSAKTLDDWEPLHCACQWDNVEAASLLLHNRADVNAVTKGNLTPLHLAASKPSSRRTLELLLWQPYLKPDICSDAKDKPYDMARRSGPFVKLFEILDESINIY